MGIQKQLDKFHNSIKLSRGDASYKTARQRDDSITMRVEAAFKEAGYEVINSFIQGSLATTTAIVPMSGDYDIDRAIVIDAAEAPENPVAPKKIVLNVLENRGFKNARIKKPCVTADYSSENVHIDFPVYKRQGHQHYLAVGKKNSDERNRSWSSADPRGLIDWVNDRSAYGDLAAEKQNQFQRLVRYLKRWRDYQFSDTVASRIHSIGLTVMLKEQFCPSFSSEGSRQDLHALYQSVDSVLARCYFINVDEGKYRVSVLLPKEPWRDIFDGSSVDTGTQFRNKLVRLRDKLAEAAELTDVVKQAKILRDLFGGDFEVPEPPQGTSGSTKKAVYATSGAAGTSQGA